MATIQIEGITSRPAAADFSAVKHPRLVVQNNSGQAALCGAGARPYGVGDGIPYAKQGDMVRIITREGGQWKAEVGAGGITLNAELASDAAGCLVVAASGNEVIGIAQEAAAAGEVAQFTYRLTGPKA